ncbi:hypothetical protein ACJX0J_017273, partial [Zea mays]
MLFGIFIIRIFQIDHLFICLHGYQTRPLSLFLFYHIEVRLNWVAFGMVSSGVNEPNTSHEAHMFLSAYNRKKIQMILTCFKFSEIHQYIYHGAQCPTICSWDFIHVNTSANFCVAGQRIQFAYRIVIDGDGLFGAAETSEVTLDESLVQDIPRDVLPLYNLKFGTICIAGRRAEKRMISEIFCFGHAKEEEDSYVRFNNDWKIIESKIEKKLSSWKGKLMTVGGRLVLINFSQGVFFWQGDEHKKKYRLMYRISVFLILRFSTVADLFLNNANIFMWYLIKGVVIKNITRDDLNAKSQELNLVTASFHYIILTQMIAAVVTMGFSKDLAFRFWEALHQSV